MIVDSLWWARPARPREPGGFAAHHPERRFYSEWGHFAAAVAERYPESVAFEVCNEPNSGHFWGGDPQRYVELLEVAHAAVKRVDPTMPVLLAGPAPRIDRSFTSREESARSPWCRNMSTYSS